MKAISFLECYYNEGTLLNYLLKDNKEDVDKCMKVTLDFINNTSSYCMKVSQPFSFEKVVELFEGFEEVENYFIHSKQIKINSINFNISEEKIAIWIVEGVFPEYSTPLPKTIDEFIILCNNLNIELLWKNQKV